MVARGGIEPPTQGFSVLCSTTELPHHFCFFNLIISKNFANKKMHRQFFIFEIFFKIKKTRAAAIFLTIFKKYFKINFCQILIFRF